MSDPKSMVKLMSARNNIEAKIIAALLESVGIPTFVPGQNLQDEFAMAQNIMGVGAVDIMVPPDSVAEARRVIEEARDRGDFEPSGDGSPDPE